MATIKKRQKGYSMSIGIMFLEMQIKRLTKQSNTQIQLYNGNNKEDNKQV